MENETTIVDFDTWVKTIDSITLIDKWEDIKYILTSNRPHKLQEARMMFDALITQLESSGT